MKKLRRNCLGKRSKLFQASVWARALVVVCAFVVLGGASHAFAQNHSFERQEGRLMLSSIREDVKKNYYDPNFHGVDLDARFSEADEKIKQANSMSEILGLIAQALLALDDSHTFFEPPSITARIEHGWQVQMIGDKCYVVAVQPGSDAEAKGLRPGDRVVSLEGYKPARANLWQLEYVIYALGPRPRMNVVVERDGKPRPLTIAAKVTPGKPVIDLRTGVASDTMTLIRESQTEARLNAHRYYELGEECLIWKMPRFDLDNRKVDEMMAKAGKRKSLVLDLRGNGGGSEETLLRLAGNLFDHDVKIGDLKRRKETKPLIARNRGSDVFKGQLVVLVDSESGSAAELLARLIQLEKRGRIIGDRTAGQVMRAKDYDHKLGSNLVMFYGASITDADIVMTDGKSLEKTGVTPDEIILPTAEDLAAQRDPVLAYAASLVRIKMTPEKAGTMFPVLWRK
jgi:C-terminal processing protease CtpA/Prc